MSNWELLKWMKFAIFQWFLSMVGVDMDMVHTYSYTPHMFCNCFVSVVYSFQNHRKVWGAWSTPPSLQGTVSYHHCSDNAIIAIRSIHDISHKTTWKYYRFLTQAYIILHLHPFFLSFSEVTSSVNLTCWHHLSLPGPPVQRAHHVRQVWWFSNHISGTFITWNGFEIITHQAPMVQVIGFKSQLKFPLKSHWNLYQILWNLIEIQLNCPKPWGCKTPFSLLESSHFLGLIWAFIRVTAFSCVPFQNGLQHPGVFTQPQRIRPLRWFKKNMKKIHEISSPGENRLESALSPTLVQWRKMGQPDFSAHLFSCPRHFTRVPRAIP